METDHDEILTPSVDEEMLNPSISDEALEGAGAAWGLTQWLTCTYPGGPGCC